LHAGVPIYELVIIIISVRNEQIYEWYGAGSCLNEHFFCRIFFVKQKKTDKWHFYLSLTEINLPQNLND
jgi:hypothetical protein